MKRKKYTVEVRYTDKKIDRKALNNIIAEAILKMEDKN